LKSVATRSTLLRKGNSMSVLRGRQDRAGQRGFTLVEFLVAFAISALLLVGSVVIMRYIVVATAENGDRTLAQLQVHYVSSWLVDDVVQAQTISLDYTESGNMTGHFPIVIGWQRQDGSNHTVTYDVGNMTDEKGQILWQLTREHKVGGVSPGILVVSEYLSREVTLRDGTKYYTRCYQKEEDGQKSNVLVLEVAAQLDPDSDRAKVSGSYEISPRSSNVVWEFRE